MGRKLEDCAPLGELGPHLTQCGLRRGLPPCQVSSRSPNATVDELFDTYDCTLTNVADQFAPERTVTPRLRPLCPWFDAEWCRAIRRNCRRLERRYRRTRDAQDKAAYVQAACRDKHDVFDQKKKQYWSQRINADDRYSAALSVSTASA